MESKRLSLPQQKNYEEAYQLAGDQLSKIDNIEAQCRKSGAQYRVIDSQKSIGVQYLNRAYRITLPDIEISLVDSPEQIPLRDRILILHYLLTARGTPPANKLITFHELPEGSVYYPTFAKRTIQPIVAHFGQEPRLLLQISQRLGGRKAEYGDMAVTIDAFPRVPITIVLWRGDEEFAPQGNVLFDATISDYLPTEDITVLCETSVWKLVRALKESGT